MSDAAQKAADILERHQKTDVYIPRTKTRCSCGEWYEGTHGQHQLAVLSETHAVVELPEPEESEFHGQEWRRDFADGWGTSGMSGPRAPRVVINHEGEIGMLTVPTSDLRPDIAEFVGTSLLAAARRARVAEGGGSRG